MFKINQLTMYSVNSEKYTYNFSAGLNYFKGKNSSGKTEFYSFIDFMFGSSEDIRRKPWYSDSLEKATMIFEHKDLEYRISRTMNPNQNYLSYSDEEESEAIDLREYKERLNSIFAQDIELLKDIRSFTEEELTYRSFTLFNFLGEKRQGAIHDFFDKCSDVKYSVKLSPILNFIFNNNLERIHDLQQELNKLLEEVKKLELISAKYDFVVNEVNKNLQKIGLSGVYSGKNAEEIKKQVFELKNMALNMKGIERDNIANLEVMYSNIEEQIKIHENRIIDSKQIEKKGENRKLMLKKLDEMLGSTDEFGYLISPIKKIISELDTTISFSNYLINDNTIKELRNQRDQLRLDIRRNNSRFRFYSLEEKTKAVILVEEYLSNDIYSSEEELKENKRRIKEIREELKALQNADDVKKINELSQYISELYLSAKDISSVVDDDLREDGFRIQYLKKGNILQPLIVKTIFDENDFENKKSVNYYIGSMARHTLIQLSGYLGFLRLILKEGKYPIIPILVIDHISKPFDHNNGRAIGRIITTAYNTIGKNNLQIFMFDDEEYESLAIMPDHNENLVTATKTGFNPFFFSKD